MTQTSPARQKSPTPLPPTRVVHTVGDVMTTAVVAAHEAAAFKEIVESLTTNNVSAVPVIDAQRTVIGVVSETDLLARLAPGNLQLPRGHRLSAHRELRQKLHAATAGQLMTAPAVVTSADVSVAQAARLAVESRVRRLPVVDPDGRLIGIVTKTDLLRAFLRPDEDIRQDIVDNVVAGVYAVDPAALDIDVAEGIVVVSGQMECKSLADDLVQSIRGVSGVIDVISTALRYRLDDTSPAVPRVPLY